MTKIFRRVMGTTFLFTGILWVVTASGSLEIVIGLAFLFLFVCTIPVMEDDR